MFLWYAQEMPPLSDMKLSTRRPSIVFLTKNHKEIAARGDIFGEAVDAKNVPKNLINALIATEDRNFYHHIGVDFSGLTRAMLVNLKAGRIVQGGSTLTQQLAKNLFLSHDRSFERKIKELILAFRLEGEFSKDEIISMYLNRVYLGGGTFGVDAAAQLYFGKLVTHLSIAESAIVAGLLKAPSRYARNHDLLRKRGQVVLNNMLLEEFITKAQYEAAVEEIKTMKLGRTRRGSHYRYFTDWVMTEVQDLVNIGQDLIVVTTLDDSLQKNAHKEINTALNQWEKEKWVEQGAFVAMSYDGAVRAMIGGRDYVTSQYNLASQARRQGGSAFKAVIFLAALEKGIPITQLLDDSTYTNDSWTVNNYGWKARGSITLEDALVYSINTAAVRLAELTGITRVLEIAKKLGFQGDIPRNLSIALGTAGCTLLELVSAFTIIANEGIAIQPYAILEIRDNEGNILYKRQGISPHQVVDQSAASSMRSLLIKAVEEGTGKNARIKDKVVGGKTGTSQKFRDAWFIGFTENLVAGAWVGNMDERPMNRIVGGNLPSIIWRKIMEK
jgi:penicillin-binding protein 1A